ncbi:BfmA/BtgA family mobilization protein [Xanthocytophaga agilis]|uniref:BfmA/BtgA family mobilization protein n=1 Tax=Xanthocytophaga agilis TaxID=3048010 RepID=A0AAE3RBQ0_9BACT|nr:BfmA/BtgA family mobilization protein [Xanthocytophaga agilis]MDJ1505254.1 BfmA/BtgA family mobilization protein [Xanthocytophaga agilis]
MKHSNRPITPKRPARRTGEKRKRMNQIKSEVSNIEKQPGQSVEFAQRKQGEYILKTVNVNAAVLQRCKQHARELGMKTLKEYAENAMLYFVKNGLNPSEQIHSEELSKEVVRLRNHIFSFLQKQEQQYMLPMFKEVFSQGRSIEQMEFSLEQTQQSLSELVDQLKQLYLLVYKIQGLVTVSVSTMLHISDLPEEEIQNIKAANADFVNTQVNQMLAKIQVKAGNKIEENKIEENHVKET